ncbi:MAG: Nif11-like leader peptide family RiPP precursor [Acidaminococcaceae bacterium]|nr:Nif11-like leader peptide family RiPP precursor [Acidaminococcaceae bacterium]
MSINKNELTKEMIEKAMQCETADELIAYAKSEGVDITKEEAEAYLAELDDIELDEETLKNVAGGDCWNCKGNRPLQ